MVDLIININKMVRCSWSWSLWCCMPKIEDEESFKLNATEPKEGPRKVIHCKSSVRKKKIKKNLVTLDQERTELRAGKSVHVNANRIG